MGAHYSYVILLLVLVSAGFEQSVSAPVMSDGGPDAEGTARREGVNRTATAPGSTPSTTAEREFATTSLETNILLEEPEVEWENELGSTFMEIPTLHPRFWRAVYKEAETTPLSKVTTPTPVITPSTKAEAGRTTATLAATVAWAAEFGSAYHELPTLHPRFWQADYKEAETTPLSKVTAPTPWVHRVMRGPMRGRRTWRMRPDGSKNKRRIHRRSAAR